MTKSRPTPLLLALALAATACASPQVAPPTAPSTSPDPTYAVSPVSEVNWEQLNPARGDESPMAGTLWGDRNGTGPTGFLFKPVDGFRSPPHIHNVTYRGVVIRGLVHNDAPDADDVWMPAGSYWVQPNGAPHITAAQGSDTLAYIEIQEGPYLVMPVDEAFPSEDAVTNVDASKIRWIDPPATPAAADGLKVAPLWGDPQDARPSGTLVKLPPGFTGTLRSHGSTLRAVVIQGRAEHRVPGKADGKALEPGGFFSSTGPSAHQVSCDPGAECVIYVRVEGKFDVIRT